MRVLIQNKLVSHFFVPRYYSRKRRAAQTQLMSERASANMNAAAHEADAEAEVAATCCTTLAVFWFYTSFFCIHLLQ